MPPINQSESSKFSQNRRFKIRHISLPKQRNKSRHMTSPGGHSSSKSPRKKDLNAIMTHQMSKNSVEKQLKLPQNYPPLPQGFTYNKGIQSVRASDGADLIDFMHKG